MFITKKKFKRKKGIVTFYYIVKHVKVGNKYRIKNVKYLGTAENILRVFNVASK